MNHIPTDGIWLSVINNLLIQFGEIVESHLGGNPFYYPIAYKTFVQIIGCMGRLASTGIRTPCYETLTGFCVSGTLSADISFHWIAIGDC